MGVAFSTMTRLKFGTTAKRILAVVLAVTGFCVPQVASIRPSDRPSLTVLRSFATLNGETVDIAEHISEYNGFGVCLLNDTQGVLLTNIQRSFGPKTSTVLHEVFIKWLAGSGKRPVTWTTFVKCLRDVKLNTLADIIEANYRNETDSKKSPTKFKDIPMKSQPAVSTEIEDNPELTNTSTNQQAIKSSAHDISQAAATEEHPIKTFRSLSWTFRYTLHIALEDWDKLCKALNINEVTLNNLRNYRKSLQSEIDIKVKYHEVCLGEFFNLGKVTWERVIRILAGNPPKFVVLAKQLAYSYDIDYYFITGQEKPSSPPVPPGHHKVSHRRVIERYIEKNNLYEDWEAVCRLLKIDEALISEMLRSREKGQSVAQGNGISFCINEYFYHGVATLEDMMQVLASDPLNRVVLAKTIGFENDINYYTTVGLDKPIHSPQLDHHKIEGMKDLEYAMISISHEDWELLCRSLKVDEPTVTDLHRLKRNDHEKWEFCLKDYLTYGTATWENVVSVLASSPFDQVIMAKGVARKYDVDFYAVVAWNNPAANLVQPNHHKIEKFDDLEAALMKNIPYEVWETLCRQLKVDEATITDVKQHWKSEVKKWELCLHDFFYFGAATWEAMIQAVASDPLNQVALAKKIAEDYGISYQEVMKDSVKDEL